LSVIFFITSHKIHQTIKNYKKFNSLYPNSKRVELIIQNVMNLSEEETNLN